jgi:hypothetical protein
MSEVFLWTGEGDGEERRLIEKGKERLTIDSEAQSQ